MKKNIVFCFLFILFFSILNSQTVNGDTLTVAGKKVLKIWGTHSERGFATGYLVGEDIKYLADNYIVNHVYMGSNVIYQNVRTFFLSSFIVAAKYQDEAQGIIDGMDAAGIDLYNNVLMRDFDKDDILMINAIVDLIAYADLDILSEFGCSSISAWGERTLADPELSGEMVITRLLDWTPHPILHQKHLLVVHFPAENDEVNWLSLTFPGFFGALSGINEEGLTAFMNVGSNHTQTNTQNLHPLLLSVRNGLESYDYNGDYQIDGWDIAQSVTDNVHLSGSIVHTTNQDFGLIIETNNELGTTVRDESENSIIPRECLVATNHFRKLYDPIYCNRYQNVSDSLSINDNLSIERSWNVLKGAAGVYSNLQMIEYAPSENLLKWSTSLSNSPAYQNPPAQFEVSELFTMPVSINNEYIEVISVVNTFPNPFSERASLSFSLSQGSQVELSIFNIRGQKIKSLISEPRGRGTYTVFWNGRDESDQPVPSGIYFYRFNTEYMTESGRLIMVK